MDITISTIKKYGKRLHRNRALFTRELFGGLNGYYVNYCIAIYTDRRLFHDPKFYHAVHMLYTVKETIETERKNDGTEKI